MSWVLYTLLAMLVAVLYRLVRGPLLEDRLLALNIIAVLIILIMCYFSIMFEQSFYLDIALIYALLSFGEVLAFVKISYIPSSSARKDNNKDT